MNKNELYKELYASLPCCHVVGCARKATRTCHVGLNGVWNLCDSHSGSRAAELSYADVVRKLEGCLDE